MYNGTIIKESLENESVLENIKKSNMRVVKIDNPAPDQPSVWTLYDFIVEDQNVDSIAKTFSDALKKGTWYIDMNNGTKFYVVFSGRVFKREKNDTVENDTAKEYGRSLGIPEKQLSWKV